MADWEKDMQSDDQAATNEEAKAIPDPPNMSDDTTQPARERYSAEHYATDSSDPNGVQVDDPDPASLFIKEPDTADEDEMV